MSLGYETYEDNRDFQQNGITGDVKRYTTESMEYPCFIVKLGNTTSRYKINVLKQMFSASRNYDEELVNSSINIYFNSEERLIHFGRIFPAQVKSFLKLFESEEITGFLNKDKVLKDKYLYILAG